MINIDVKITGPGLVVNKPVAIITKALIDAGYGVDINKFDGQNDDMEGIVAKSQSKKTIKIEVDPLPWGG